MNIRKPQQLTLPSEHFDERWKLAFNPRSASKKAGKLRKDIEQMGKDISLMPGFKPKEKQ
jgi:hypothetical protein